MLENEAARSSESLVTYIPTRRHNPDDHYFKHLECSIWIDRIEVSAILSQCVLKLAVDSETIDISFPRSP